MIAQEIMSEYSEPAEQTAAMMAYNFGIEWVNQQPKSWCSVDEKQSKREARKEARRKRKEQYNQMYDYIYQRMVPDEVFESKLLLLEISQNEVDGVPVVGFGFIMMAILAGIISWIVQKILNQYWS